MNRYLHFTVFCLISTLLMCCAPETPSPPNQQDLSDKLLDATRQKALVDKVLLSIPNSFSNRFMVFRGRVYADMVASHGYHLISHYDATTNRGQFTNQSFIRDGHVARANIQMSEFGGDDYTWSLSQEISLSGSANAGAVSVDASASHSVVYLHSFKEIARISFDPVDLDERGYWQSLIHLYVGDSDMITSGHFQTTASIQAVSEYKEQYPIIAGATIYVSTFQAMRSVSVDSNLSASELYAVGGQFYQKQGGALTDYFVRVELADVAAIISDWPELYAQTMAAYIDNHIPEIAANDEVNLAEVIEYRLAQVKPDQPESMDVAIASAEQLIAARPALNPEFQADVAELKASRDRVIVQESLSEPAVIEYLQKQSIEAVETLPTINQNQRLRINPNIRSLQIITQPATDTQSE